MNQNQNESHTVVASLTTSGLSPLVKSITLNRSSSSYNSTPKPFTLNRSSSSYNSTPKPLDLSDNNDDDPLSSLLDSFRKSNFASISKGNFLSLDDTPTTTTLHVEAASLTNQNSLFEQHPLVKLPKNGVFDGLNASHFCVSLPNNSPCVTRQGLFGKGKGYDAGNASLRQKVNHAVDGWNPCSIVSDDIFEKSIDTIVAKDILSNSEPEGTMHAADESSSILISSCKVAPVGSSIDMSSSECTPRNQNQFSNSLGDSDTDMGTPCWNGARAFSLTSPEVSEYLLFDDDSMPLPTSSFSADEMMKKMIVEEYKGIDFRRSSNIDMVIISLPTDDDLLSVEEMLIKITMEERKGLDPHHSSNIVCEREKTFNMDTCLKSVSVIDTGLKAFNMDTYLKSASMEDVLNSHCGQKAFNMDTHLKSASMEDVLNSFCGRKALNSHFKVKKRPILSMVEKEWRDPLLPRHTSFI